MTELLRAELIKLRTTRMAWGALVATVLLTGTGRALHLVNAGRAGAGSAAAFWWIAGRHPVRVSVLAADLATEAGVLRARIASDLSIDHASRVAAVKTLRQLQVLATLPASEAVGGQQLALR